MDAQTIRKVALDAGNGYFKAGEVREGQVVTAILPSQVGVGDTNLGLLDLGGMGKRRRRKNDRPVSVQFVGGDYLVGYNVSSYTRPLERLDPRRYTDSMEVRALAYAVLAQLLDGGPIDVAMIVALPVEVMMAPDAKKTVEGIENWLLGEHRFTYNGAEARVNVRAIRPMAQPAGAFFAWGLDDTGKWTRPDEDLTGANVAVLDSGFGTLDSFFVKAGRVERRFTGGEALGVRRAIEEIQRAVKAQYKFNMLRAEADGHIRDYLDHKSTTIIVNGEKCDLKPVIRQAVNSLASRTIDFVDESWRDAQLSYVLLTGGGALILNGEIQRSLPQAQLLPDPVTANAVGLARLAQRPGTFKGL